MGLPSSTQVLLLLLLIISFTSFLIHFHQKINDSGFVVLASTDPELIQNNNNGDYERVSSKKFLQVFLGRNEKKKIEQSRVSRRNQELDPPISNRNIRRNPPPEPPEDAPPPPEEDTPPEDAPPPPEDTSPEDAPPPPEET